MDCGHKPKGNAKLNLEQLWLYFYYLYSLFESDWEAPKVVSVGISICNGGTENDTVNSVLNLAYSETNAL